jgi:hypothetical protein
MVRTKLQQQQNSENCGSIAEQSLLGFLHRHSMKYLYLRFPLCSETRIIIICPYQRT